jgi:hypothetical protein
VIWWVVKSCPSRRHGLHARTGIGKNIRVCRGAVIGGRMSWYWHEIRDEDSARYATTPAVWVSYLIAVMTGLIAIVSLLSRGPVEDSIGLVCVDCVLFAVIGWRIASLSRVWAVVGLSVYLVEMLASLVARGLSVGSVAGLIVAVVFLATYINALRGTVAYHKYLKLESARTRASG